VNKSGERPAMISLQGVCKSYGGALILKETSLVVAAAERLAIVGPSGCGKSTLLRTMIGLVTPDRGMVTINGVRLSEESLNAVRLRIGYVIQDGGLFPHLTNERNVTLVARHRGWSESRIQKRIDELANLVHVDRTRLARYPSQLSGGERQRVGLMRALMLDPDVLLLDEPMGALDPIVRARLQDELLEVMNRLEKCVVLVTHDMFEASKFGQRIAVMRDGKIVQIADLKTLTNHPADPFVVEFLRAQRTEAFTA
jgi:osmoprotectant transport system ATP-binding protein